VPVLAGAVSIVQAGIQSAAWRQTSLVFFFSFLLEDGGGASLSGLAWTLVTKGAATSAIENIASVRSLIANLLMHPSCFRQDDPTPKSADLNSFDALYSPGLNHRLGAGRIWWQLS
jgi:hypothetical protein